MDTREKETRKFLFAELSKLTWHNSKFYGKHGDERKEPIKVTKARAVINAYDAQCHAQCQEARKNSEKMIEKTVAAIRAEIYLGDLDKAWKMLQQAKRELLA